MEYNKEFEELLKEVTELARIEDFEKAVNSREFEIQITKIASVHIVSEELNDCITKRISEYYKTDKKLSFVLFFVLFTMWRRQNYGDLMEFVNQYDDMFKEYTILRHIVLMAVLHKCTSNARIYREIKRAKDLVRNKTATYDFTTHTGFLNAYCALVCKYFEYNLDERKESENIELLKLGLESIEKAISIETKEKGDPQKVYNKFFLNRGRVLVLLERYEEGEAEILKAIELIPASVDRNATINEYNQHLMKVSIIHAFDMNEEKVKDLDKLKINNYKSLALMTTLLGFLLGTINIFTTVEDGFTLLVLMLGYCGLLLILAGTVLFGFSLNFKERKKGFYAFDMASILVGVAIFVSALIIAI